MENTPEAAPQGTEAAPQTAPTEPIKNEAPEINAEQVAKYFGTDTETLGKFQKFVDANGQFNAVFEKVKSKISNPQPAPAPEAQTQESNPTSQPQPQPQPQQPEPTYTPPKGAVTQDELMAQYYFERLSKKPEYAPIAEEISGGAVLKEMARLGIPFRNQDGSWNNDKINDYLDLRAKTVPAKPTAVEPNASAAPTVTYTEIGENGISNIDQAYKILMEPGNPVAQKAEEYIREHLNGKQSNK